MNRKQCLILGSNSDVGQACAYTFAAGGYDILLASRNVDTYQARLAADISIRHGVVCHTLFFDAQDYTTHTTLFNSLERCPDVVLSTFGYLGNQELGMRDFKEAYQLLSVNFIGHVSLLNIVAEAMKRAGSGCIIGVSSVAGERGRQSNFLYGAAKAGFTTYLSGLRNSLYPHKVHVLTVIPGFIRSKMIEGLSTPALLTASPKEVAEATWNAFLKKKNVQFIRPIWKYIMWIIRLIPESIFKRLHL